MQGDNPPMRAHRRFSLRRDLGVILPCCICHKYLHQLGIAFKRRNLCGYLAAVRVRPCDRNFAGAQFKLACTGRKIGQQLVGFENRTERLYQRMQQIFCGISAKVVCGVGKLVLCSKTDDRRMYVFTARWRLIGVLMACPPSIKRLP